MDFPYEPQEKQNINCHPTKLPMIPVELLTGVIPDQRFLCFVLLRGLSKDTAVKVKNLSLQHQICIAHIASKVVRDCSYRSLS